MRASLILLVLTFAATGCGTKQAASPTPTAGKAARTTVANTPTVAPAPTHAMQTPTVAVAPTYAAFVRKLCHAFAAGDTNTISGALMNYEYNTGLRWGMMGDGEGHTSDPSLMSTWFTGAHVTCRKYAPGTGGHGILLTAGWAQPGPWGLLDLDYLNGHWTINDFTFGTHQQLVWAMQVGHPILQYPG